MDPAVVSGKGGEVTAPTRRRIVVVSPVLPYDDIPHAGGVYLRQLHTALDRGGADLTFIVTHAPNAKQAVGRAGAPRHVVLLGSAQPRTLARRALMRVAYEIDGWVRRWDPTWPPLAFSVQLLTRRESRDALQRADVVDVHWPEYARLLGLIRWINPRARLVATLHDVLSQRWDRVASGGDATQLSARRRALCALASARRLERKALRRADVVVVFSDKDRRLLGRMSPDGAVEVVAPPLALNEEPARAVRSGPPTAVFVSLLARDENEDAARWLVDEIWPAVARRVPGARLRLVGKGASPRLLAACERRRDVDVVGFVEDLDAEYQRATVCVVPLRLGAGVKFKTIEGLVAGVPTVTTTVGAEGIGGPELFAVVSDAAPGLADALVRVLTDPAAFDEQARRAQGWARDRFGEDQFGRHVSRIYGLSGAR